jgi:hypothetical protein
MVRKAAVTKRKTTRRKALKRTKSDRAARSARLAPGPLELREIESLRGEIERVARTSGTPRWNANPDEVRRSVVKLVLTLVDFVRQLLERQALRRVDANTLTPAETEAIGIALMQLETTVRDLAAQFDLNPEDLNLDLGPIGKLV